MPIGPNDLALLSHITALLTFLMELEIDVEEDHSELNFVFDLELEISSLVVTRGWYSNATSLGPVNSPFY